MKDPNNRTPDTPGPTDEDSVLAIKRDNLSAGMTKRSFLRAAMTGLAVSATAACSTPAKNDDQAPTPAPGNVGASFVVGGTTYEIVDLQDYNRVLPQTGANLAVVGYVGSDYFFRSFDADGSRTLNHHESKLQDRESLTEMKQLVATIVTTGRAEPTQQTQFAALFTKVAASTSTGSGGSSGKRLQSSEGSLSEQGRRMQGSAGSGQVSGRRMQGAEGRPERNVAEKDLGTVVVNGTPYHHARVTGTYTDGYSTVTHDGGTVVVRTDSLPEIVQMQLSVPVPNPAPRPAAIPVQPKVAPEPPPRSSGSRGGGSRSYGSHYWRPN